VLKDTKTRQDYLKQQSRFVTENGQGDESAEFSTSLDVAGFSSRLLAVRRRSKLFRLQLFWLFTLLGLSVPYRVWFSNHCDAIRVSVIKETSVDPPPESKKSWFRTSDQTSGSHDEIFRSMMQQLKLYASDESEDETAAVLEDVEAAITAESLREDLNATSTEVSKGNATKLEEENAKDSVAEATE
jgi:hypothetical protein